MITIVPFSPDLAPIFDRLNRAWIEELFTLEPFDELVLAQPEATIIEPGGEIWFGAMDDAIIGTCALLAYAPGVFEFTKLGVEKAARGRGVARALLRHCCSRAKVKGAHTLQLFTSSKLIAANALYRSEGFAEVEMSSEQKERYRRVDVMYALPLTKIHCTAYFMSDGWHKTS